MKKYYEKYFSIIEFVYQTEKIDFAKSFVSYMFPAIEDFEYLENKC